MNLRQSIITIGGDRFSGTLVNNVISWTGSGGSIEMNTSHYFYTGPTNRVAKNQTATDAFNNSYVVTDVITLPTGDVRISLFRDGTVS